MNATHRSTRPIFFTKSNGEKIVIDMKDVPYKSVTVEQKTDSSIQINLDFSDPLEEEDDDDLIVEITDPKEIEKFQISENDLIMTNVLSMPNRIKFDDEEEYRWYFDQFITREQILAEKERKEREALNK